jgi:ribulose-5-phosphate 4-epimerase/fuculose-1-phosphate aldolase
MTSTRHGVAQAVTETEIRRELAAVYRLVARYQMTDLIFTHISAKLPGPDQRFLINPYGLLFEEVTASSLVVVDLAGNILEPTAHTVNPAGFVIHSAIHRARNDAHSVLHTHTRAGCAVAAIEEGLLPVNQMSLEFYGRVGYHDYEGIALNLDEQQRLVANLGSHPALILRNHGLLTVGGSPREAFLRMFYLNRACEIQVAASSAGTLRLPSAEVCDYTARQFRGEAKVDMVDDMASDLAWAALLREVERHHPDYAD